MFTDDELSWLQRRLATAAIDILFWCVGCGLLFGNFSVISQWRDVRVWAPTLIVLVIAGALELLTGGSLGKSLLGWSVRQPGGGRAALGRLLLRGAMRLLPAALFLAALLISSAGGQLTIIAAALTLALFYVSACYITLIRQRLTLFDVAAGTETSPNR